MSRIELMLSIGFIMSTFKFHSAGNGSTKEVIFFKVDA
jgi:hypothetical protein